KTGYNNYVARIMFQGPSTISDYSASENHKNYFQFSFPTAGYDSIAVDFSIAGGQNSTDDYLELVYSTDDGASWVDAGSYNALSGWWLYQDYKVAISARNKDKVIVRLIANTTSDSGSANFTLDYFKISGAEYVGGGAVVDDMTTITWPFSTGEEGQMATYSDGSDAFFSVDWVASGSNLFYKQTRTEDNITYTLFNPTVQTGSATDIDLVSFNIRPKTGLTFTPDSISFDAIRIGTNSGYMDIYWKSTDGTLTSLASGIQPVRNGQGNDPHVAYDLSSLSVPASDGTCGLYVYIYNLGDTKQVGLANIVVHGHTQGTIASIPTYKLNATVSPSGAGSVTTFPVGNEFDDGTEVTLTAATRNFGYQFKEWQDGDGTVLSSTSPYTFTINSDTTIVAVYEALTTYNFTVDILGSKWGEVKLTPEPTDGKYEAGTTVSMEVVPNPVTTFSYWEDNTTATSRTIVVDGDKSFSATFDEVPFITGWDFRSIDPKSSRGGDYYSETSNTGLLNVYNQDGSVTGWLGHTPAFSPAYPCAYLWTVESDFASNRRYWEASFSTEGYSNIQVKAQMAGSYQHYESQLMQCSLNDTDFVNLDTVDVSGTWADLNATLPKEYEGQEKVFVRWIADTNSTLVSPGSGNDGTAITNIFVFADKEIVNDSIAPTLISTVPAEGATNATSNGSIVLTFDEKMAVGAGDCTLGETVLMPKFGSKTVTFPYTKLTYDTEYTFTVPDSALTDMAGNAFTGITVHFKTMSRPIPAARLFDAVIAQDGTGDFTTVQAAIDAAPDNSAVPYLIFIKNGVYSGHVDIPETKPRIHLIGQERDSVIISDARLAGASPQYPDSTVYHVSVGATAVINSSNCYFENITFENKFGYDNVSGPQALALYTIGDRIILKNCWLRSYQDTYLTTYSHVDYRHYLLHCKIEGAVDFIYGGGDVFFDQDTIYCKRQSGGYIVAPSHDEGTKWGYVFSNCTIDGIDGATTYFGRPWHGAPKTSFFNTTCKINIYPVGWYYKMGAIPAIFADYNSMDADGNPLDLSQRIDTYEYDVTDDQGNVINTVTGTAKNSFTDEEAAQYTYENVTSGSDGWDPRIKTESTEAPVISLSGNTVSWAPVDYAICYVVTRNSEVIGFTTESSFTDTTAVDGNDYSYEVQAASEYGALSAYSNVESTSGTVGVSTIAKDDIVAWAAHSTLYVKNAPLGAKLRLISLNGTVVLQDFVLDRYYSKSINLQRGIYILVVNQKAYKVLF
ncbi:MAG TPA: pectinesterase family protein, partial [Sunxiuqinia sp.]|nr:pectinesterase family protein [Sunxiuqinia sp.]